MRATRSLRRHKLALIPLWLAAVGAITLTVYLVRSPEPVIHAQTSPTIPAANATPAPNSTPDTSSPFWYVPYLNQERDAVKFDGAIAGVSITAQANQANGFDVCPGTGRTRAPGVSAVQAARNAGAVKIDDRTLPPFVATTQVPDV